MPTQSYVIERIIPERTDPRLGRIVNHDSRSRRFPYRSSQTIPLLDVEHPRRVPIFDQGDVGSCTGMAALGALGCDPFYAGLAANTPGTFRISYDTEFATSLYSEATKVDGFPGNWPPEDTGSDGTSVAKVCQARGFISGYQHCFSFTDFAAAVQDRPVIVGTNWYSSFWEPDAQGVVTISSNAYVEGGHEWLVRGYSARYGWFLADNSWGTSFGLGGSFRVPASVMKRLLAEQGDATIFTPASLPSPEPTPTPPTGVPTPLPTDLLALRNGTAQWRGSRWGRGAAQAKMAVKNYLAQQHAL